jgi:DNA-directed RNA polymerase subunit K/omega
MPPKKLENKPTVSLQEVNKTIKKEEIIKKPLGEVKEKEEKDDVKEIKSNKNYADDAFDFYKNYDPSKNKFDPILSIYEKTNLIGIRATQIENGAPVFVDVPEGLEDVVQIAEMELAQKKLPLIICREGREYWRAADLTDTLF